MASTVARAFYRRRTALLVVACASPVVLLAGIWWLVTQVLLVPAVPGASAPPAEVAAFIMHAKGLPRLDGRRSEAFLEVQLRRLVGEAAFRERFLAEYRTASPAAQKAFRLHLFDAFKPLVLRDVERFEALAGPERQAYLDERIVAYNRLGAFWGDVRIHKDMLGSGALAPEEVVGLLLEKTSEQERQRSAGYARALAARVAQILADPALEADIRARIAATGP